MKIANTLTSLEIFKSGRTVATNGTTYDFSDSELAKTAAAYNPSVHEAPLVIGHPTDQAPAYGWTKSVTAENGTLTIMPTDVDPDFAELVNARRYGKISASFYAPDSPANPVQGVYYLRHVGFLGAQPPAVKGLRNPSFADDADCITIEFSETISELNPPPTPIKESLMTPEEIAAAQAKIEADAAALATREATLAQQTASFSEREAALKQKEQAAKKADISTFVDGLVSAGRVLPRDKTNLVEFMAHQNAEDVIEFSEHEGTVKKTLFDWMKNFLSNSPKRVDFSEYDTGQGGAGKVKSDAQIARDARTYHEEQQAKGNNISFAEAVDYVSEVQL